jgi:hypothetical protein
MSVSDMLAVGHGYMEKMHRHHGKSRRVIDKGESDLLAVEMVLTSARAPYILNLQIRLVVFLMAVVLWRYRSVPRYGLIEDDDGRMKSPTPFV